MEVVDGLECWVYDGKRYPSSGLSAVAGKTKEEFSPEPLPVLRDAAGLLRLGGPPRGHGPRRHPRLALLPDDHPVLRPAVHGGERPRVRPRVPQDLQRLARRGVVRRRPRSVHPADADPAVGSAPRRRGDGAHGRPRRHRVRVLREPGAARPADHPRQGPLLGPGDVDRERAGHGGQRCTWARRRRSPRSRPTPRSWPTSPGARSARRAPCCRGCSAGCSSATPT